MRTLFGRLQQTVRVRPLDRRPSSRPRLECLEPRCLLDAGMTGFVQTNLVSDIPGFAAHFDRDLINPWGFSETPQGQFRVSSNGAGVAPLFDARGKEIGQPLLLQPPLGSPPGTTTTPNGQAVNTTSDFVISDDGKSAPASLLFSTEDGTILGFNPRVDPREGLLAAQASDGAVYKLLAEASNSKGNFLYATDFHNNKIDVFDKNFDKVKLGQNGWGTFKDPHEPAGFAPFGIKLINGVLYVTYAKQKGPDNHDDQEGPGNGFIDKFDTLGHFLGRFASGSAAGGTAPLNSPIGMAVAPPGFGPDGKFGGALLVGNFGDSHVSAFDLKTGKFLGQLSDAQGHPLVLNGGFKETNTKGLWGIAFGNGKNGADPNTLFFAAGINLENDGLFGKVTMSDGDHDRDDGHGRVAEHADSQGNAGPDLVSSTMPSASAHVLGTVSNGSSTNAGSATMSAASLLDSTDSQASALRTISFLDSMGSQSANTVSASESTPAHSNLTQSSSSAAVSGAFSAQVFHRKLVDQVFSGF